MCFRFGKVVGQEYEVMGGGAGTVSAAGGWLQSGGLSTGLERLWGIGVDQVLELEMVLPTGEHVKFGPSEWLQQEGFVDHDGLYPQTVTVTGKCNANIVADESKWQWQDCEKDIPFGDLWFAVRGGGGGTYGIVTAVQYQLHDLWNLYLVTVNSTVGKEAEAAVAEWNKIDKTAFPAFEVMWNNFMIDFLWQPSNLGVSEAHSNGCGSAAITIDVNKFSGLWCKDGAAEVLISTWKDYVVQKVITQIPFIASYSSMLQGLLCVKEEWVTYPQRMIRANDDAATPRAPIGHVPDNPPTTVGADTSGTWSAAIPIAWLVQKSDVVHAAIKYLINGCHLMGGHVPTAHDGMSAVPSSVRQAGLECGMYFGSECDFCHTVRNDMRPYRDSTDGSYPPDTEFNHISPDIFGPLKSNWSAPCPSDIGKSEQEKQCVSLQESVWGSSGLVRLTEIKNKVDPKHVFDCYRCVGHQSQL